MKKFYLLMMFALLGMVANAAEVKSTFTSYKNSEFITDEKLVTWDIEPVINYISYEGGQTSRGIQFGSSKKPAGDFKFFSKETFSNVTKIEVSMASTANAIVSAFVGETQMGEQLEFNSSSKTLYTFQGSSVMNGNISFEINGEKAVYIKEIIIYLEENQTQVATPTFSVESGEIYPDTEISINCATEGATIKYFLDEDITTEYVYSEPLTFDIGTTVTITAWAEAEGLEASEQAVATYNVVEKPEGTDFVKVTDLSQLEDGDKVIIACESKNTILAAPDMDGGEPKDFRGYVEFGLSESFTLPGTSGASILTLGIENGQYTFFDGTYYLEGGNKKLSSINEKAYWNINVSAEETVISMIVSGTEYKLQYNASSPRFCCYSSKQMPVSIYREPNGSSSVNDAVANEFKAVAVANGIEVNVAEAGLVSVYNAAGQLVANVNVAEGATTINVAGGFYIVKAGNNVAKVLVK